MSGEQDITVAGLDTRSGPRRIFGFGIPSIGTIVGILVGLTTLVATIMEFWPTSANVVIHVESIEPDYGAVPDNLLDSLRRIEDDYASITGLVLLDIIDELESDPSDGDYVQRLLAAAEELEPRADVADSDRLDLVQRLRHLADFTDGTDLTTAELVDSLYQIEDDYISITDLVLVDLIAEFGGDTSGGRYGRSVQDAANELEAEPSGRRLIARLRELAEHAEVEELGRVVAVNVSASVENRSDDLSTTIMKSAVLFVFMNDTTETPTGTPFWLARVAKEPGAIVVLGPQGVQQLTFRSEERQKLTDKDRLLLSRAFEDEYHYVFAVLDARGKPWSADGRLTAPGLLTGSHMKLTAQVWGRMREIVSPAVPWWQFWVGEKSPHQ